MIFFSIIIPTYNRAHLITETIDSVLAQTCPNFEIIIVDDGSTDNTEQVIRNKYGSSGKLEYFKKKNEERGAARNFGLKHAKGNYALFFDSDDFMHYNHLETLDKKIQELGNVNLIATKHDWEHKKKRRPSTIQSKKEGWYGKELFIDGNGLACNFCVRRDNPDMKLFRENRELVTMEDWIFLLENILNDKLYLIDKTTLTLIDHDERSLTKNLQQTIKKRIYATEWIEKNIPLTKEEIKRLWSSAYVFCSVFSYLDLKNIQSIKFLFKAISKNGVDKKKAMIFAKTILFVNWLRR
jgi:GalNAc5-diNAcBac-PP-undecaprenol beta-1,3-glucosyltransferase